jgi:hypothetical protein
MDIKEALELEHSNTQATKIATYIEKHPDKLKELMNCFFSVEFRLCQKAAWPLGKIGAKKPKLIQPYLKEMLDKIDQPVHDAAVRNTIRILQDQDIPEELIGRVYEKCFGYLIGPHYPVAFKVFSMTVLSNIAHHFPELIPELILAIEDQLPIATAGYKSRAKKEMNRLRKLNY